MSPEPPPIRPDNPLVVRGSTEPLDRSYRFIRFSATEPVATETNRIAAYVLNLVGGTNHSIQKLKKLGNAQFQWRRGNEIVQGVTSLDSLSKHMRSTRSWDPSFPRIECPWLDGLSAIAKPDAPIATLTGDFYAPFELKLPLGDAFPLRPCIDREGVAYASLQAPLLQNILRLYRRVVTDSHGAVALDGEWLNDLRMLLNDCVSIVDVTLHQLYFAAQFRGGELGFHFDAAALGPRHGVRLKDKLHWVTKITGRTLEAHTEVASFKVLKDLRNHLTHFDPPCLAYTVEDVVGWLNRVPAVGRLLWRIRDRAGAQLNPALIECVLLPPVEFCPRHPGRRVRQGPGIGYDSVTWPGVGGT